MLLYYIFNKKGTLMLKQLFWITVLITVLIEIPVVRAVPKVVVSIKPIHSLVAGVMYGVSQPALLIPGNTSPHTYSLRPSEASLLQEADLVFWIGSKLETFLVKPLSALAGSLSSVEMLDTNGIRLLELETDKPWFLGNEKDVHHWDPHLWLDPYNGIAMVEKIHKILIQFDPQNAAIYQRNTDSLKQRLKTLDETLRKQLSSLAGRRFVVFHPAFSYMEARYKLERTGVIMINPERPPGARHLSLLRHHLQSQKVLCLFSEPQFEPRLVKMLVEGTQVKTAILDPMGVELVPGPKLYFNLLRKLGHNFRDCLLP